MSREQTPIEFWRRWMSRIPEDMRRSFDAEFRAMCAVWLDDCRLTTRDKVSTAARILQRHSMKNRAQADSGRTE